jgi:hypothetical protein
LARIVYCLWLIPCEHGPKIGVPSLRIPGWCATRRDLGGGRRVAYFLLTPCEEITHLGDALWPVWVLQSDQSLSRTLSEIPLPRERPGFSVECGGVLVCLGRPDAGFRPQLRRITLPRTPVYTGPSGPACDLLYGPARIREPLLRVHKKRLCKLLLARRSHDG